VGGDRPADLHGVPRSSRDDHAGRPFSGQGPGRACAPTTSRDFFVARLGTAHSRSWAGASGSRDFAVRAPFAGARSSSRGRCAAACSRGVLLDREGPPRRNPRLARTQASSQPCPAPPRGPDPRSTGRDEQVAGACSAAASVRTTLDRLLRGAGSAAKNFAGPWWCWGYNERERGEPPAARVYTRTPEGWSDACAEAATPESWPREAGRPNSRSSSPSPRSTGDGLRWEQAASVV